MRCCARTCVGNQRSNENQIVVIKSNLLRLVCASHGFRLNNITDRLNNRKIILNRLKCYIYAYRYPLKR